METLICKKCGEEKEFTDEFFRRRNVYGKTLRHVCRVCEKKNTVEWRKKNRSRVNASIEKNRNHFRKYNREYRRKEVAIISDRYAKECDPSLKKYPDLIPIKKLQLKLKRVIHGATRN